MRPAIVALSLGLMLGCDAEPQREPTGARGAPEPHAIARGPDVPLNPDHEVIGAQFGFPTSIGMGRFPSGSCYGCGTRSGMRGRTGHPARITMGSAEVDGPLPKEIIRRIVRRHLPFLKECYEAAAAEVPGLGGLVVLEFTVMADGTLEKVWIDDKFLDDSSIAPCLLAEVAGWKMPKPTGGSPVRVRYPLRLTPPSPNRFRTPRGPQNPTRHP